MRRVARSCALEVTGTSRRAILSDEIIRRLAIAEHRRRRSDGDLVKREQHAEETGSLRCKRSDRRLSFTPEVGQVWAAEKQAINLQDVEDLCNKWGWSHKLWSSSIIADTVCPSLTSLLSCAGNLKSTA